MYSFLLKRLSFNPPHLQDWTQDDDMIHDKNMATQVEGYKDDPILHHGLGNLDIDKGSSYFSTTDTGPSNATTSPSNATTSLSSASICLNNISLGLGHNVLGVLSDGLSHDLQASKYASTVVLIKHQPQDKLIDATEQGLKAMYTSIEKRCVINLDVETHRTKVRVTYNTELRNHALGGINMHLSS
jgi:hypothetical protein